jgi:hypothetical protein
MSFREIEYLAPLKETAEKTRMFQILLKSQALSYFEPHLRKRLEAEDSKLTGIDLIQLVLRDIGLEYNPKHAICIQKYYMRKIKVLCTFILIYPYNNL